MKFLVSLVLVFCAQTVLAGEALVYKDGKQNLEGYLALPQTAATAKRPAVLIIHQWMGLSPHEKAASDRLAKEGYVVLAADIYGTGNKPVNLEGAQKISGQYKADVAALRSRVKAGIEALKKQPGVDANHIVVMGYCFGGTAALEALRGGLPVAGVVSFHGGLQSSSQKTTWAKNKPSVLVLHGAIDPYVAAEDVTAFYKELNEAKVDYQFVSYAGAVHSFTDKAAGSDPSKGAAYNEKADRRSWLAFEDFLSEVAPVKAVK